MFQVALDTFTIVCLHHCPIHIHILFLSWASHHYLHSLSLHLIIDCAKGRRKDVEMRKQCDYYVVAWASWEDNYSARRNRITARNEKDWARILLKNLFLRRIGVAQSVREYCSMWNWRSNISWMNKTITLHWREASFVFVRVCVHKQPFRLAQQNCTPNHEGRFTM